MVSLICFNEVDLTKINMKKRFVAIITSNSKLQIDARLLCLKRMEKTHIPHSSPIAILFCMKVGKLLEKQYCN